MKLLPTLAVAGLLLPSLAFAQVTDIRQAWINPGFYSLHYDRHEGLEDANPGIGIEWPLDKTYSLTAGRFRNSNRAYSNYLGLYAMPFEFHGVRLGVVAGGFDGYPNYRDGNWFPALLPVAAIEGKHWGLNVAIIPTIKNRLYGAISFQVKYRFSDGSE
jgi:hypothetical protein